MLGCILRGLEYDSVHITSLLLWGDVYLTGYIHVCTCYPQLHNKPLREENHTPVLKNGFCFVEHMILESQNVKHCVTCCGGVGSNGCVHFLTRLWWG